MLTVRGRLKFLFLLRDNPGQLHQCPGPGATTSAAVRFYLFRNASGAIGPF